MNINLPETSENPLKTCLKCGIPQPLDRFPLQKGTQKPRNPCKACRAAESQALRRHPDHAERIREAERIRSTRRRPAIKQWEREHPDNMRPGRQRRWRRRAAKLAATRQAARATTDPSTNMPS